MRATIVVTIAFLGLVPSIETAQAVREHLEAAAVAAGCRPEDVRTSYSWPGVGQPFEVQVMCVSQADFLPTWERE